MVYWGGADCISKVAETVLVAKAENVRTSDPNGSVSSDIGVLD